MKREIGLATLFLGDSMDILQTAVAIPGSRRFDHIITDPPYESHMHNAKAKDSSLRIDGRAELRALGFESIDAIRPDFVRIASQICNGWFITFCTSEGIGRWADHINASTMKYKRACHWIKPDSAPQLNGQGPAQGAEHFVCAWAGFGHARWNAGGKRGVYTYPIKGPERHGVHPTEKPRRLMSEIIADFTDEGQLICDPFMGSGTTGVAAVMDGRRFFGIEKDPKYFEIACERIEQAQMQLGLFDQMRETA